MRERNVVIRDIIEEVNLIFLQEETSSNRVNRSITPTLVEESTVVIEVVEVAGVGIATEPVEITDFEVRPEVAVVVGVAAIVTEEGHGVVFGNVLRKLLDESLGRVPEGRNRLDIFVQTEHEAVLLVIVADKLEGVVADVAEKLNARFDAPVVAELLHDRVLEEEAGFVATHMSVADRVTVDDFLASHFFAGGLGLVLVDKVGIGPVLGGDLAIMCLAGGQSRGNLLECIVKRLVVQEDPVVVIVAVEAVLDLANGTGNLPDVGVTGKRHKGGIGTLTRSTQWRNLVRIVRRCAGICVEAFTALNHLAGV